MIVLVFYLIAIGWSWLFLWAEYLVTGGNGYGSVLRFMASLGPLLAAIVVTVGNGGRDGLRQFLKRATRLPCNWYWYPIALLGYLPIPLAAIELHVWMGDPRPLVTADTFEFLPMVLPIMLLDGPINEEPGWRGFALPYLQLRHSALRASLLVGIPWALWHWPLALQRGSLLYQIPFGLFLVQVCALSIVFAWVYNASGGSLLTTILFHGSINTWAALLPTGLPAVHGEHLYLLNVVLTCLVAVGIVLLADPRTLSRFRWHDEHAEDTSPGAPAPGA